MAYKERYRPQKMDTFIMYGIMVQGVFKAVIYLSRVEHLKKKNCSSRKYPTKLRVNYEKKFLNFENSRNKLIFFIVQGISHFV